MNETTKRLFIGGPMDGYWLGVDDRPEVKIGAVQPSELTHPTGQMQEFIYLKQTLIDTDGERLVVYLSKDEHFRRGLMDRLINGYKGYEMRVEVKVA